MTGNIIEVRDLTKTYQKKTPKEGATFWQKLTVIGIRFGEWRENLPDTDTYLYFLCFLLIPFVLLTKNSNELLEKFSPNWMSMATG